MTRDPVEGRSLSPFRDLLARSLLVIPAKGNPIPRMPQISLQARRPSREGSPHPSPATLQHDTWCPESCCGTEALPGLEEGTRRFGAHSSLLRLGWGLEPRMAPKGQRQLKASRVCMLKLHWPLCMVLVWNPQHQLPYGASPRLPSRARLGAGTGTQAPRTPGGGCSKPTQWGQRHRRTLWPK